MKYPKTIQKMLDNKIVLYVVIFFAITNFLGYAILGNYMAILLFLVFGSLTYLVEPNKVMVLLVPLILTSLLMIGKRAKEGFEAATDTKSVTKTTDGKPATSMPDTTMPDATMTDATMPDMTMPETETMSDEKKPDEKEPSGEPQTDGMTNKKARNRIDYASTIEDAYGNLSQILGSDGIKGLTDDTHKLMKQQLELAEAMKSMTPIVEQAQNMLQGLDIKNLGGLADLAKQFTGGDKAPGNSLIQKV